MGLFKEIYLTKKNITNNEWQNLINIVSKYNGILKSWKIIITDNKNEISYFIKTKCNLPPTINNLDSFLLKDVEEIKRPISNYTLFSFPKFNNNILDLINFYEIKNKGSLTYLEISLKKIYENKIISKVTFYLNKNNKIIKYKLLLAIPTTILTVDFSKNKRYFYKSSPKYLEIKKVLHLLNSDTNNALFKVDTFPYLQGNFYLNQNNFSFDKHSIIVGSSGSGKSKFISLLISNIFKNNYLRSKYKIVVIDPHARLEEDIGGFSKVIDFKSNPDSIDLFINNSDNIIESTTLILDLLKSLIADQYNSKLERILRHSIYLLLINKSFNLKNLKEIILNIEYRNELLRTSKYNIPSSIINFFLTDFNDLKTKSYGETISPIISFIDEIEMVPVFSKSDNYTNLETTIENNFLTLFSLDRTKLGDKIIKTISGLIMQQIMTLIEKRKIEEHIIFIIDEVSIIENPILSKYLSEARKYNLSLILATQYFEQISLELKNAIFANVINYYIFRVSKTDASILVNSFNMKIPLDDLKETKEKLLTELNNRECIVRIESKGMLLPAFKGITLDYKSIPRIKTNNNESKNINKNNNQENIEFNLNNNINLKDILISNSSYKEVYKHE